MINKHALITVSYNSLEVIEDLFVSLDKYSKDRFEHIIIDNASSKNTDTQLKDLCTKYGATYIPTIKNGGFAYGSNIGIRYAKEKGYSFIALINPDILFSDEKIFTKIEYIFQTEKADIVGPMIHYSPDIQKIYFAGGWISPYIAMTNMRGKGEIDSGQYSENIECDWITGCALWFRASIIDDIGYLPEEYFLYFEESDWCMRAGHAGKRIIWTPTTSVNHAVSSVIGYLSPIYLEYMIRNYPIFARRYLSWWEIPIFYIWYFSYWVAGYTWLCIKNKNPRKIKYIVRGLLF